MVSQHDSAELLVTAFWRIEEYLGQLWSWISPSTTQTRPSPTQPPLPLPDLLVPLSDLTLAFLHFASNLLLTIGANQPLCFPPHHLILLTPLFRKYQMKTRVFTLDYPQSSFIFWLCFLIMDVVLFGYPIFINIQSINEYLFLFISLCSILSSYVVFCFHVNDFYEYLLSSYTF